MYGEDIKKYTLRKCVHFIGEKSLYSLTGENVGIAIAAQLHDVQTTPEICRAFPWSTAKVHELPALEYFRTNADEFVNSVFISSQEQGEAITDALVLVTLSDKMKVRIISEMIFSLDSLSAVSSEPVLAEENLHLSFHDLFYHPDRIKVG